MTLADNCNGETAGLGGGRCHPCPTIQALAARTADYPTSQVTEICSGEKRNMAESVFHRELEPHRQPWAKVSGVTILWTT